jgi:hypothetical protein
VIAVAAALVLLASAAGADDVALSTDPSWQGTGPLVGVVGDSISWLTFEELHSRLDGEWTTSVNATLGVRVVDQQAVAASYVADDPSAMVIELGTNDVLRWSTSWDGMWELSQQALMLSHFDDVRCVVWVNVDEHLSSYWPDATRQAAGFNAGLGFWRSRVPDLRIADWNAALLYLGRRNLLFSDDEHPNEGGQLVLAHLVGHELAGCRSPMGNLDAALPAPGAITVAGWAIDIDVPTDPIAVHLYVDGAWGGSTTADVVRPDVAAVYPDYGPVHGYEAVVPVPPGRHTVCAYAINVRVGTTNPLLRCLTATVG